jgi:hypothetical protein
MTEANQLILDYIRNRQFQGGQIDPVEIADGPAEDFDQRFYPIADLDEVGGAEGKAIQDFLEIEEDGTPNEQRMEEMRMAWSEFVEDCIKQADEIEFDAS